MSNKAARLIVAVALTVFAAQPAAGAQPPPKVVRIGFIGASSPVTGNTLERLRQGLRELGYVEGDNIVIEARWADGKAERFPDLIADVLRSKVDVLVVGSNAGALAAKKASITTPIVFAGTANPVGLGIVESLARPGGNITGVSLALEEGISGKWVELLKETAPRISRMAVLLNPAAPASRVFLLEMQRAARAFQVRLQVFEAQELGQVEAALSLMEKDRARALIVTADPLFLTHRGRIVEFAGRRRLPAMYFFREFVDAGGLMAYGPSLSDQYRRAATYVDKILKGAKPVEPPVEQPMHVEFVVNLKTAKALGLTFPQTILIRADHILQ